MTGKTNNNAYEWAKNKNDDLMGGFKMITKCKKCNVTTDGYLCPICMLDMENKKLKSELRKWNEPVNERLAEAKKQYIESGCSASARVYITALEHALKHEINEHNKLIVDYRV